MIAAVVLGGLVAGCTNTTSPEPSQPTNPFGLDFTSFDSALTATLAAEGLRGATAVVVHRDSGMVYLRGYGAYDADRLFLLASASKILSVGVLMRLADQGQLDMDAPIGTYVSGPWGDEKGSLTLSQMVSNSSGMVGLVNQPLYRPYLCQYRVVGTLLSCGEEIYNADDADRIVPPDTYFRYGGAQWQLAGSIAMVASGKSWSQLVRETYIDPCGATSLGYANPFQNGGARAYPAWFDGDRGALPPTENPNIEGGAYITAEDYGKILLMHLRGGLCGNARVLSDSAVALMQRDRIAEVYGGSTGNALLQGYGLGWWIDRNHPGVVVDIGMYGATPWLDTRRGYGAMILVEGSSQVGGVLWLATKPQLDAVIDGSGF